MKKELFIGAVVGAVVSWFLTRRYYEEEIEACYDEMDRLEGIKKTDPVKFKKVTEKEMSDIIIAESNENKIDRKKPRVNVVTNVKDLAPRAIPAPVNRTDIHIITEDEYDEPFENYDKIELQYHINEDRLYEANEELDVEDVTMREILDGFYNDTNAQFRYIRNHKLESDFLIEKEPFIDMDSYDSLAEAYQEEKQKILDKKNRGV